MWGSREPNPTLSRGMVSTFGSTQSSSLLPPDLYRVFLEPEGHLSLPETFGFRENTRSISRKDNTAVLNIPVPDPLPPSTRCTSEMDVYIE